MSADRDVTTRIVRSWLHEDANEDADRILNLVLDQIDTTPQRPAGWLARRFSPMNNNLVRVALVAAVLVAAVIVGASLLPKQNVGPPAPTPTPIPLAGLTGPLDPGFYVTDTADLVFPIAATVTIPEGWSATWAIEKNDLDISFWTVQNASTDPCRWESTELNPELRPSVQDLVDVLRLQQAGHAMPSTPVTVNGYSGQFVEYDWPAALDTYACDQHEYRIFVGPGDGTASRGNSVGHHSMLWILDVDGLRVVIDGTHLLGASEAQRAEIRAIVDTIHFEQPGPVAVGDCSLVLTNPANPDVPLGAPYSVVLGTGTFDFLGPFPSPFSIGTPNAQIDFRGTGWAPNGGGVDRPGLRLTGPDGTGAGFATSTVRPDLIGSLVFDAPGTWRARIEGASAGCVQAFSIEVRPAGGG